MKPNYSSSSSSSPCSSMSSSCLNSEESGTRNWLDLPSEIMAMILVKVGLIDVLTNAQRVCTQWRSITEDPDLWRVIDIDLSTSIGFYYSHSICRRAIHRTQGHLVAITISDFGFDRGSDDLLRYIADSVSHLQRLRLVSCYDISDKVLIEAVKKLPCLEEIDLTIGYLSEKSVEAIGRCCSLLKSFKFNKQPYRLGNKVAFAIAETMPNLRHLQLFRNGLTNTGLLAILDGCPHLESLDIRKCFRVYLGGRLGRRCFKQIKVFLEPCDPSHDDPFGLAYDENWYSPLNHIQANF